MKATTRGAGRTDPRMPIRAKRTVTTLAIQTSLPQMRLRLPLALTLPLWVPALLPGVNPAKLLVELQAGRAGSPSRAYLLAPSSVKRTTTLPAKTKACLCFAQGSLRPVWCLHPRPPPQLVSRLRYRLIRTRAKLRLFNPVAHSAPIFALKASDRVPSLVPPSRVDPTTL